MMSSTPCSRHHAASERSTSSGTGMKPPSPATGSITTAATVFGATIAANFSSQ